jgi:phage terminase small subunit
MELNVDGQTVELTEQQLAAFEKLTKLQQGVVLNTLSGIKLAEAYRLAGGKGKTYNSQAVSAKQILQNPKVAEFMDLFKVDPSSSIAEAIMTRDKILADLTDIASVTIDDVAFFTERPLVDMENGMTVFSSTVHVKSINDVRPEARKAIKSVKQTKNGLEIVLYDTLAARKQITDLCGYEAPKKTELTGPGGAPLQFQEIPDEELEAKLKALGLGRYHNQLASKRVD